MSKRTTAFYNRFSFFYPLVDIVLRPQKKRLSDEVNNLPEGKLLEIGVGNGAHLNQYRKHEITGIDTSAAMLAIARKNSPATIRLLEMNGEALLFDDLAFDYVVLSHVIAVVDDPQQVLTEVYRVLKPGGKVLILNHYTPEKHWLRHVDSIFESVAGLFRFKSFFRLQGLQAIGKFTFQKETGFGPAAYFKLLIYQK